MPSVGIITANFNNGKYFQEYLDGLLSQTVKPKLVSIVDDASTDDSFEIIKKELGLRSTKMSSLPGKHGHEFSFEIEGIVFKALSLKENVGPAKARNIAIEILNNQADILFVYDSDDVYYPTKIEHTLKIFAKYAHVGLVYSDYDTFDENKKTTLREFKEPFSYERLCEECIISNNSAFLLKAFETVGKYDNSLRGPEDYDLWLRLAEVFAVYHIPKALYKYRISGSNLTIRTPKPQFAAHVQRVHQKRLARQGIK